MAYTAPVIDASGQTLANLEVRGFDGHVQSLVASLTTNAATAAEITLVDQLLSKIQCGGVVERARNVVDAYIGGEAVSITAFKAEIFDLQLAFAAIAGALGEIGTLIDANAGTLSYTYSAIGMPTQVRTLS